MSAAAIVAAIDAFDAESTAEEYTDTGRAWELLRAARDHLAAIPPPPTTTQAAVFAAVAERLDGEGLALVRDGEWANTGTCHAIRPGSLDAVGARLRYDFQGGDRATFRRDGHHGEDTAQTKASFSTGTGTVDWWVGSLDALVGRVVDLLAGRRVNRCPDCGDGEVVDGECTSCAWPDGYPEGEEGDR